jgi:capsular polysaccharide biosynthesis protein
MLYVNNTSATHDPNSTISSSQISAAQSLVKTYTEILKNRTTLNQVIEHAEVNYTYKDISGMIKAAPSNDTEIMKVTVTTEDPYEAAKIANSIAEILPQRIKAVIEGAKMNVVEYAEPDTHKVAPSITKYTFVGIVIGVFLAVAFIAVSAMMDDTLHDEEFITQNYTYPILARIPDLSNSTGKGKKYGYYYQDKKYGYYQYSAQAASQRESENNETAK